MLLKLFKTTTSITLVVLFICFLTACSKDTLPRPSSDFYVSDYANSLMIETRAEIIEESAYLYEATKDIKTIGGAQVVVATILVNDLDEARAYDTTSLFRSWKIGKNDMGVLITVFYSEYVENEITYTEFVDVVFEAGYRLEAYFVPGSIASLREATFYTGEYSYFTDVALLEFYYTILNIIYVDVYQMEGFEFDMDYIYEQLTDDYIPDINNSSSQISILYYLFSPYSNFLEKLLLILAFLFVFGGGGLFIAKHKGAGGSSGGFIIRRRK